MLQLPCTFQDNIMKINSLNLEGFADTPELALLECIKSTPYFLSLKNAQVVNFKDHRGRDFIFLEVQFTNLVYEAIMDIEPVPKVSVKSKQLKSFIIDPTSEEVVKLGY